MNAFRFAVGWSLGIAFLGLCSELQFLLVRHHHPKVRSRFWQTSFLLALALSALLNAPTTVVTRAPEGLVLLLVTTATGVTGALDRFPIGFASGVMLAWAVIALVRLARIVRSVVELSRLTRDAAPVSGDQGGGSYPVRQTERVQTPSASFLGHAILVPPSFTALPEYWRRAIVAHETIHLKRRHGVALLFEEVVLAFFWFHPAMRRLVSRVRAAREECVDAETIGTVGRADEYRSLLVALAVRTETLIPAISHEDGLRSRLQSLVKLEKRIMPNLPLARVLSTGFSLLGSTAMAYELGSHVAAAPALQQGEAKDAKATPPRKVISRVNPVYPEALKTRKISGLVQVVIVVDSSGAVTSATPRPDDNPELAKAAIEAIRQWRFEPGDGNISMTHTIQFRLSDDAAKK